MHQPVHDHDEKPPAPDAPPAFDFNKLPRWRSRLFPAPDDPPGEPAQQEPVPAATRETAPEVATPEREGAAVLDLDRLPRVRPVFMVTPDDPPGEPAPQEPAPAPARETTPEFDPDTRARGASVSVQDEFRLRNPAPVSMCQTFPVTDAALWTAGQAYQCVQRTALRSLANGAGELIDVLRELAAAED